MKNNNAVYSSNGRKDENKRTKSKYCFFWKAPSPFSQWTRSFYELDGVQYKNSEQGMMHGKALLFEDYVVANEILKTSSPKNIKQLGRKVHSFKQCVWNRHREEIVYRNNMAKFTQNNRLRDALLATKGQILAEASPCDTIWGVGLHEKDAGQIPEEDWPGLNLLGQILMRVRDDIIEMMEGGKNDDAVTQNIDRMTKNER